MAGPEPLPRPPTLFNATDAVRKALSAILRTGERFGTGHLIDILTGQATDKVRDRGHDALPTFAVGRDLSKPAWGAVFRQMMGRDLVRPDPERHGALRMTDDALPILRGEADITLRQDTIDRATTRTVAKTLVRDEDAPLMSALKAKRRALAEAQNVPAYVIFTDRTLAEMAETRPAGLDDMARISGVGARKLDSYGAAFLEVINGAAEPMHPQRRRLAGRESGEVYDRLADAHLRLMRGKDGTAKPMSLSTTSLRKIAEAQPRTLTDLDRAGGLGAARLDRFGEAFLSAIAQDAE